MEKWILFLMLGVIVSVVLIICYCALIAASNADDMSEDYISNNNKE